jgi:hypothetical protein
VGESWLVTDPAAEAGSIETLPPLDGWTVVTRADLAASGVAFGPDARVAITTEAAMPEVLRRLDPNRREAIATLKDKVAFRTALRDRYPDLDVRDVTLDQLPSLTIADGSRYVVKPARGVFGTAVHEVDKSTDLAALRDRISAEVARGAEVLSASALSGDTLIVEPYIEGEEYAVDAVYTMEGDPIIVGAYRHPMPHNPAYLHVVYHAGADVLSDVYDQALAFYRHLGATLDLHGMAMHGEFRLGPSGQLVPIEVNSMRVGGMGLGNMLYHTAGIDAFHHFRAGTLPDWSPVREDDHLHVFLVAYNGATVDTATHRPDWDALRGHFDDIVLEVPFDHRRQLAFGVLYARQRPERLHELLALEFDGLFVAE